MQKKLNITVSEDESHQFAFYGPDHRILKQLQGDCVSINDEDLVHRVVRVVKLKIGERFIVFDRARHSLVELISCSKHEITICILSCHENKVLQPKVTCLLPLLKKEALEEAVYSLAELGINEIQLVATQKSRKDLIDKEMQRLQKITVAAAEQSKHYAFPLIYSVKNLQECLKGLSLNSDKVVFDISGTSFFDIHKQILSQDKYIIVGPEGGLTIQELSMIKEHGFTVCSLTPTVLRALQAVAVGAALFRIS